MLLTGARTPLLLFTTEQTHSGKKKKKKKTWSKLTLRDEMNRLKEKHELDNAGEKQNKMPRLVVERKRKARAIGKHRCGEKEKKRCVNSMLLLSKKKEEKKKERDYAQVELRAQKRERERESERREKWLWLSLAYAHMAIVLFHMHRI